MEKTIIITIKCKSSNWLNDEAIEGILNTRTSINNQIQFNELGLDISDVNVCVSDENKITISESEYNRLKTRSDKWDLLDQEIGKIYDRPNEDDGDLCEIGEIAASHLGYL